MKQLNETVNTKKWFRSRSNFQVSQLFFKQYAVDRLPR